MTIDTQKMRAAAQAVIDDFGADWYGANDWTSLGNNQPPSCDARHIAAASPTVVIDLLDQIDAQAAQLVSREAEIARLRGEGDAQAAEIEWLRADSDSWADQASDRLRDWDEMRADRDRLHEALRWAAAALQEACRRSTLVTEKDLWLIGPDARTTAEILDAADAALQGEPKC